MTFSDLYSALEGVLTSAGRRRIAKLLTTTISGVVPVTRNLTVGPDTFDLSADRTFLASVTNDAQTKASIVPNTLPSAGQIPVGNGGGTAYQPRTVGTDATLSSTGALTLATVNSNVGSFTNTNITVNAKGLITAAASGTLVTPGGSNTQYQYNNAGAFGGVSYTTYNGTAVTQEAGTILTPRYYLVDSNDTTKKVTFVVSSAIGTTRTVTYPDANSNTVVPDTGAANNFLTGISSAGLISKAQPTEANLSTSDITTNNVSSTKHGFAPKSPANAQQFLNGAATPAFAQVATGDLLCEASTGNAPAGDLGEYSESNIAQGSEITLTNGVTANITSLSLTAGDWDVDGTGIFDFAATTTTTLQVVGISKTTATSEAPWSTAVRQASFTPGAVQVAYPTPTRRISLSGTTTVYLIAIASFGTSTCKAYGILRARRVR